MPASWLCELLADERARQLVAPGCYSLRDWLYEWQTLITGGVALLIGIGTLFPLFRQVQLQRQDLTSQQKELKRLEDERRDTAFRKGLATRALLPDALSALDEYCSQCMALLEGRRPTMPDVPADALKAMKEAIAFMDNDTARAFFELVSFFQVHRSRVSSHANPNSGWILEDLIYDNTKLFAGSQRLFEYARNLADTAKAQPPTQDELASAFKNAVGHMRFVSSGSTLEKWLDFVKKRGAEEESAFSATSEKVYGPWWSANPHPPRP